MLPDRGHVPTPEARQQRRRPGSPRAPGRSGAHAREHVQRAAQHAQHELLALLRVERTTQPRLAPGERPQGHDREQRREGRRRRWGRRRRGAVRGSGSGIRQWYAGRGIARGACRAPGHRRGRRGPGQRAAPSRSDQRAPGRIAGRGSGPSRPGSERGIDRRVPWWTASGHPATWGRWQTGRRGSSGVSAPGARFSETTRGPATRPEAVTAALAIADTRGCRAGGSREAVRLLAQPGRNRSRIAAPSCSRMACVVITVSSSTTVSGPPARMGSASVASRSSITNASTSPGWRDR